MSLKNSNIGCYSREDFVLISSILGKHCPEMFRSQSVKLHGARENRLFKTILGTHSVKNNGKAVHNFLNIVNALTAALHINKIILFLTV